MAVTDMTVTVDAGIMKGCTLTAHIHETYRWRVRKAIGLFLMRLATIAFGCGLEVEDGNATGGGNDATNG
jgi:hypothetical protein